MYEERSSSEYIVPPKCICCLAPTDLRRKYEEVNTQERGGSTYTRTSTMQLPVCEDCQTATDMIRSRRIAAAVVVGLLSAPLGIYLAYFSEVAATLLEKLLGGTFILLLLAAAGAWLGYWLEGVVGFVQKVWNLPPAIGHLSKPYDRRILIKPVSFTASTPTFANKAYNEKFRAVNKDVNQA